MSITIEEAIARNEECAAFFSGRDGMDKWKEECEQYAVWFRELVERRKEPEIIRCGECVNFAESGFCKVAGYNVHRKSNCMKVFGAEKKEKADD